MTPQAKAECATPLGLYVHVPFCARSCDFCAFYQEAPDRAGVRRFLETIAREFAWRRPDRTPDTVFWGGGTPGLLRADDLRTLGEAMLAVCPAPPSEWTVELAPSTVKPDKIAALRELGVNRISMGVQSFDEKTLEALGRQHSRPVVERAIQTIRDGGIDNLNLDLIFAIPGQTIAAWEKDLATALTFAPEHLSTYCLTFEEDTKLWARLMRGQVHRRSEDDEAAFYERSVELLSAAGLPPYEVSNFARPGHACRHNQDTWRMHEWIGYGPSAASQWQGRRFTQPASLDEWKELVETRSSAFDDLVELNDAILATDAIVFGLRTSEGIDPKALRQRFPGGPWDGFEEKAAELAAADLLRRSEGGWRLTPPGRLLADRIGQEFHAVGA